MTITFITGANKGLGHESARRLIAAGHQVYVGARDRDRGKRAADELGATYVPIDVTDQPSVDAAAEYVREQHGHLDVLVNNAGIGGSWVSVAETRPEHLHEVYETNVYGVVRVTRAFVPLLEQSEHPMIVNVSSGMGSIAVTSDPERLESTLNALTYTSSKTALNMVTTQYAKAYPRMRINAVDPGYTGTDFNNHQGPQSVEEGTDAIVAMATMAPDDARTGTFTDRDGLVPW
ncbi:SDR family NAD(P)-dependent oxidoreductase [Solicola gregarius]|uniref:SDR family NAD(P)-dependent oxidoreductase n=1 Tax=Solicola gregarius TaxID=2908642 RepID=A0AA46TIH2_9ACTN|nr:SDR family NAD(P)-dependent oxidoreductase [Solicola gregarius]UYM05826.1 SDR family NAD(P)-dependent oxidoreductase [Solicola gregarius]